MICSSMCELYTHIMCKKKHLKFKKKSLKKELIVANHLLHIYGLLPSNQILPQCSQFLDLSGQPWLLGTFVNC